MIAHKLRELAQATADQVHAKRHPATAQQNRTRRREGILRSMWQDADRLERVQRVLEGLAAAHDAGEVPAALAGITNRAQVEALLSYEPGGTPWGDNVERLARVGIAGRLALTEARVFAGAYLRPKSAEQIRAERIRAMEGELIGQDIPGFFPTPRPLIERMLDIANLQDGQKVLEPSAGKGDILDAIRDRSRRLDMVRGLEIVPRLREICRVKGHEVIGEDFLEWGGPIWDRVIMNPPFEQLADIDHVHRAYELLQEGGRLVAIMGAGAFNRDTRKAEEFRTWLDSVGGYAEALPENTFNTPDAWRRTGVRCMLVTLDK